MKLSSKYLIETIREVLLETEEADADFTNKIQDFLDSKDLESLKSALNLLDVYAMSGLIEKEEANNLKKRMYKVIQEERMVLSDPKSVYDFINSEEFSSSFDKFAMNDFRRETFSDLYVYSGKDINKIVKLILPDYEERLEDYEGNPFSAHYVIEDLKGQSEVDEILARFKQFQGNGVPYVALITGDDPYVLVGPFATSIANFGRESNEVFGYRPKTLPYEIDGSVLKIEEGEGNPYLAKNSPLFDGEDVAYHITIKNDFGDWVLHLIFDDGHEGYMRIDYSDRKGFYEIVRNESDERFFKKVNYWPTVMAPGGGPSLTKEEMLTKVKEITNIDLTDVGPSHYERDLMKEEDEDDDGDSDFLEKLFDLVSSGEVEQAFDLADSLGMDKELIERIVNDEGNDDLNHGLTWTISDKGTIAIVDYALTRPELTDKIKRWLNDDKIGLPFTELGKFNKYTGTYDGPIYYEMYRKVALLVFQDILKNYDESNELNEENFGRESRGEILEEGWKDQWPNEFGYLLGKITNSVKDKPDIFAEALAKIFYRIGNISYIMPIKFYRSIRYKVLFYANKGIEEQSKKVDDLVKGIEYVKNEPTAADYQQEDKDAAIKELEMSLATEQETLDKFEEFKALIDEPFYFGSERKKEAQKQGRAARAANPNDKLPVMRVSNKLIKSIRKQLTKWRDKNVMNTPVYPYIGYALVDFTRSIESQQDWAYEKTFEGPLATLVQFIKKLRGNQEDLGKKLMTIVNKSKNLKESEFIIEIEKFIDEGRQIEFIDCKDAGPDVPCVFLKLDDGMFWHSTSVDYCEITQTKMSNCGAASDPTGMLYNLMSNEGGTTKYYVTLEYSESKDKVIQVLGKANTLPKEKYWPNITKFFEAMDNPLLSKDAFVHMYDEDDDAAAKQELDQKIQNFVEGIGASMIPPPEIETWDAMKKQIREGYYSDIIQDPILGGGRVGNTFRASIIYGAEEDGKVKLMLNVRIILQSVTNDMWEQWRLNNQSKEIQRINQYSKTNLLREAITKPSRRNMSTQHERYTLSTVSLLIRRSE